MRNTMTMFELNEKYSAYPTRTNEYEIDGKKYVVHSHFVGNKDIDEYSALKKHLNRSS